MYRAFIDSTDKVHIIALRKRPDNKWVAIQINDEGRYDLYDFEVDWNREYAYRKLCKEIERSSYMVNIPHRKDG